MLKLADRYPGQTNNPTSDMPYGAARNRVSLSPLDYTGTPLERDWVSDLYGASYALIYSYLLDASGTGDNVTTSDVRAAVEALAAAKVYGRLTRTDMLDGTVAPYVWPIALDAKHVKIRSAATTRVLSEGCTTSVSPPGGQTVAEALDPSRLIAYETGGAGAVVASSDNSAPSISYSTDGAATWNTNTGAIMGNAAAVSENASIVYVPGSGFVYGNTDSPGGWWASLTSNIASAWTSMHISERGYFAANPAGDALFIELDGTMRAYTGGTFTDIASWVQSASSLTSTAGEPVWLEAFQCWVALDSSDGTIHKLTDLGTPDWEVWGDTGNGVHVSQLKGGGSQLWVFDQSDSLLKYSFDAGRTWETKMYAHLQNLAFAANRLFFSATDGYIWVSG